MSTELQHTFMSIGLSQQKAEETAKNRTVSHNLSQLIELARAHLANSGDSSDAKLLSAGALLYNCASKVKQQTAACHLPMLAAYIVDGRISSDSRLLAALEFLLSRPSAITDATDREAFERSCGVGVEVTAEQLSNAVTTVIESRKQQLLTERYAAGVGQLLAEVRRQLPWCEGRQLKQEMDAQLLQLLGPVTDADRVAGRNKQKQKQGQSAQKNDGSRSSDSAKHEQPNGSEKTSGSVDTAEATTISDLMKKLSFHKPGENYKTDGYQVTPTTMSHMQKHLAMTGGQVRTRFPPEPNGILHIGHAKAININFGYAAAHNGVCFLRYDDTNPEKEEARFFDGIRDMVEWLGYKPYRITHSSDHFQQLYEWACRLISTGNAYVCHQRSEEMRGQNPTPSPWRDRPVSESLRLFEDMKNGVIDEGGATLRLKLTLEEGKLDPVAYRIKFVPHHRTGNQWCIYPTYDYTHCLCDSLEQITHSMCTKEFASRRSSYYWLCNTLDLYCPVQWEYGRLNIGYTVVSKRKIANLITQRVVADWDDPRLFTLTALRRRGVPPEAINNFCARLGVTGAQIIIDPSMLDAVTRDVLNTTAPRVMAVLDPLLVIIDNLPEDVDDTVHVPDFPGQPDRCGSHMVRFGRRLYIERSDYRSTAEPGFRRLTTGQPVGLRHAGFVVDLQREQLASDGSVQQLHVSCCRVGETAVKPKAFIHWVCEPKQCRVRLYERLFQHQNPEDPQQVPGGYLSDVNANSLEEKCAFIDRSTCGRVFDKFQFERIGFFSVDPDSTEHELVFNRTVSLKEDSSRN